MRTCVVSSGMYHLRLSSRRSNTSFFCIKPVRLSQPVKLLVPDRDSRSSVDQVSKKTFCSSNLPVIIIISVYIPFALENKFIQDENRMIQRLPS